MTKLHDADSIFFLAFTFWSLYHLLDLCILLSLSPLPLGICSYNNLQKGFSVGSDSNEHACNSGDPGSIPGSGRSLGEENSNPLQYSCLENSMERETWLSNEHVSTYKIQFLRDCIGCQPSFTLIGTSSGSSAVSVLFSLRMLPFLTYACLYSISHYCLLLYFLISGSLLSKTSLLTFWAWQSWTFIVLFSNTLRFHLWEWYFGKERNVKILELHSLYVHSFTWTWISVGMEMIFKKAI